MRVIKISDEKYAALPEDQRFLLDQIMVDHGAPENPFTNARLAPRMVQDQRQVDETFDANQNNLGGITTKWRP